MTKPKSLELADSVILGISLGEETLPQSGRYSSPGADRNGQKKLVRKVLGIEVPDSSALRPLAP